MTEPELEHGPLSRLSSAHGPVTQNASGCPPPSWVILEASRLHSSHGPWPVRQDLSRVAEIPWPEAPRHGRTAPCCCHAQQGLFLAAGSGPDFRVSARPALHPAQGRLILPPRTQPKLPPRWTQRSLESQTWVLVLHTTTLREGLGWAAGGCDSAGSPLAGAEARGGQQKLLHSPCKPGGWVSFAWDSEEGE